MRAFIAAVAFFFCAALSGCASGPKVADPRVVYVWPLDLCPSEAPVTGAAPRFGAAPAILAALGGDLINAALAVPFAALNNAAQADKNGFSVSNVQNRNYYSIKTDKTLTPPGCFVIAYAAPGGGGNGWCNNADFSASVPACKKSGMAPMVFDSLPVREPLFIESVDASGKQGFAIDPLIVSGNDVKSRLAVPQFYAELALRNSPGASNIVALEPVAMFYPRSLIDGASCSQENGDDCDRRMLALTISLQGAAAGASTTPAKFGATFQSIAPSPRLTSVTLLTASSISWTALPTLDASSITKSITDDGFSSLAKAYPEKNAVRVYPVTLNATIAETKNPNIYLQALNGAFNQQAQTQLSTAIANGISFGGAPSVDAQTQAKAASQVLTDNANAASALAALIKDCANTGIAAADLQILTMKEQQANLDATLAGQPQPFPQPGADGKKACPGA
ncbi:hypothetical protein [Paraburkholderia fungorum]|uniref:hypothetical protein n=1 Tax=Paraburkholderia fungorum TaxID=134537 RepID=UPI0020925321|nr:hypothetical protein [Paraburkholderia fungorum]USU16079.1 hypothetical protein NFE55_21400 [Paraburkholderia fungorum]USU24023.1 hypothetical protein NFS19_21395 [Paraburkholderia fungorum]